MPGWVGHIPCTERLGGSGAVPTGARTRVMWLSGWRVGFSTDTPPTLSEYHHIESISARMAPVSFIMGAMIIFTRQESSL